MSVSTCCPIMERPKVWSKWLDTPGIFLPKRCFIVSSNIKAFAVSQCGMALMALMAISRLSLQKSRSSRFIRSYKASVSWFAIYLSESLLNRLMDSFLSHTHSIKVKTNFPTGIFERLLNPTLSKSRFMPICFHKSANRLSTNSPSFFSICAVNVGNTGAFLLLFIMHPLYDFYRIFN
ncbi:hypothetical protein BGP_2904 [Beggiatoa sp. PS]|nr:hypothetical protein BGP_2904 [Beggiatoa sp. PS]